MRNYIALVLVPALILSACSGGGSSNGGSSSGGSSGGSSSGGQVIATPGKPNVDAVVVNQGPPAVTNAGGVAINTAYVSVIICIPGGTVGNNAQCQQIDFVQVDTQSSGLRIVASGATPMGELTLPLPVLKDAGGHPMAECLQFASGSSWGSLATADLHMLDSTETALSINVQIIGDPVYEGFRPATCPGSVAANSIYDSVPTLQGNGIIGVGPFMLDCGSGCVNVAPGFPAMYYSCPTPGSCTPSASPVPDNVQVQNPVPLLSADSNGMTDNNGVILELPAVGSAGMNSVNGALVFGIATQANNTPPASVTIMTADPNTAFVTASMNGTMYPDSFLDAGSTGVLWGTTALPACGATAMYFYCPASTTNYTTTLTGTNNNSAPADFSVANASNQFSSNPSFAAFSNLGGTNSADPSSLDFGMSFFFGHNVYTGVEGTAAPGGGTGPYYGF